MLKDGCWGSGGKLFASYSEGVVDTLNGYGEGVDRFFDHPVQTTCNAVGQLITDPTKPVRNIGAFYCNLASASYNHDWNSVAYSLGGATTHTAVIGSTYTVASSIPKSVTLPKLQLSQKALINSGGTLALSSGYELSIATARVSTAGAVSIGEAAIGANIMYAKPSKKSHKERADNPPSWAKYYEYDPTKSAAENAKNALNDQYPDGNWKTGPGTEYNQIVKCLKRDKGYK